MEEDPNGRLPSRKIQSREGNIRKTSYKEDTLKGRQPYRKITSYKRDIKCRQAERVPLSKIISLQEDERVTRNHSQRKKAIQEDDNSLPNT